MAAPFNPALCGLRGAGPKGSLRDCRWEVGPLWPTRETAAVSRGALSDNTAPTGSRPAPWYGVLMPLTLRARVRGGRIVVEDTIDLPDDTELRLLVVDDGDELDDEDRARLHAAIEESQAQIDRGETVPLDQVLADLRAGRLT
jgi:hypothetical protein